MKLLTETLKKTLKRYPIYSQDGKGKDAEVICKFFNPCGSQTWYVLEGNQEGDDYYLFTLFQDESEEEYGYVLLSELESLKLPFGLGIERDIYFQPCKVSQVLRH